VYSPKWQANGGAEMRGDVGIGGLGYLFRADVAYRSEANINGIVDNNPQGYEPSYATFSARYSVLFGADRQYSIGVFGENLTDQGSCQTRSYQPFGQQLGLTDPATGGIVTRCNTIPPRTLGVSFKAGF
jgi:hypothetical protein